MNFEDYENLPTNSVITHMTAGAIAGVMEHCVMYPLDSVKTRMQSLSSGNDGIKDTFLRMVRTEGPLRPIRGMSAMVIGAGPSHALYFSSYEYLKNTMARHTSTTRYHTLIYGASGCISTLLHDGLMTPAEVVKQRMQMNNSPFNSVLQCIRSIYRTEGLRAFYRSYTTQLTMNIPFQSIHFMVYEFAQKVTNKERVYSPGAHMFSGAMAGAIAAAVTTPLDVCKTLLNTQQVASTNGMIQAVKTIYRLKGVTGYFRGMQARVVYQMPATAICWSTYEFFKYILLKTPEVRLTSTTVKAENEDPAKAQNTEKTSEKPSELHNIKPRDLPAMSAAGLYGSISFNTMHTADARYSNRTKDSITDVFYT